MFAGGQVGERAGDAPLIAKIFYESGSIGCASNARFLWIFLTDDYCFRNKDGPSVHVIRPATPRTKFRLRTAHPGGFLLFGPKLSSYMTI